MSQNFVCSKKSFILKCNVLPPSKKYKQSQSISDFNTYINLKRMRGKEIKNKRDYEVKISHKVKKNHTMFFSYIRSKKKY